MGQTGSQEQFSFTRLEQKNPKCAFIGFFVRNSSVFEGPSGAACVCVFETSHKLHENQQSTNFSTKKQSACSTQNCTMREPQTNSYHHAFESKGGGSFAELRSITYWCLVGNGWRMGVAGMIINSYCGSFPHSLRLAHVKLLRILSIDITAPYRIPKCGELMGRYCLAICVSKRLL